MELHDNCGQLQDGRRNRGFCFRADQIVKIGGIYGNVS